jgi:hypothetical protein
LEPCFNLGSTIPDRSSDLEEARSDSPDAPLTERIVMHLEQSGGFFCGQQLRREGLVFQREFRSPIVHHKATVRDFVGEFVGGGALDSS